MTLNYTANKNILIEAKESCRVPVPVVRCPLDKILADRETGQLNPYVEGQGMLIFFFIHFKSDFISNEPNS